MAIEENQPLSGIEEYRVLEHGQWGKDLRDHLLSLAYAGCDFLLGEDNFAHEIPSTHTPWLELVEDGLRPTSRNTGEGLMRMELSYARKLNQLTLKLETKDPDARNFQWHCRVDDPREGLRMNAASAQNLRPTILSNVEELLPSIWSALSSIKFGFRGTRCAVQTPTGFLRDERGLGDNPVKPWVTITEIPEYWKYKGFWQFELHASTGKTQHVQMCVDNAPDRKFVTPFFKREHWNGRHHWVAGSTMPVRPGDELELFKALAWDLQELFPKTYREVNISGRWIEGPDRLSWLRLILEKINDWLR